MSLLQVEGVGVRYGGVVALDSIDLSVQPGEGVAVIGPNGAGKTTLFNVIAGVQRPVSGTVSFGGRQIRGASPAVVNHLGIARTFQVARPFRSLSVYDNVAIAVGGHRYSRGMRSLRRRAGDADADDLVRDLLSRTDLADAADRAAGQLTMGELRRLEIARALAGDPRLLLLDEPAAGVGADGMRRLGELITQVRAAGISVLLVEHYVGFALSLCDRAVVLDMGRMIAHGPPDQVRSDPAVITAYLGRSAGERRDRSDVPPDGEAP